VIDFLLAFGELAEIRHGNPLYMIGLGLDNLLNRHLYILNPSILYARTQWKGNFGVFVKK
jgi:hypothetical protein